MRLNLDLAPQLMLNGCFLQLRLEQNFQGDDVFAFLLACKVHVPKLALSKWPPDIKIVQGPSVSWNKFGLPRNCILPQMETNEEHFSLLVLFCTHLVHPWDSPVQTRS